MRDKETVHPQLFFPKRSLTKGLPGGRTEVGKPLAKCEVRAAGMFDGQA
jgi:hypothetical protein